MNSPPQVRTPDGNRANAEESTDAGIVDEDEEARKFADLQPRAVRAGHVLMRTSTGYMLLRGASSFHSSDLNAIVHYLVRGEASS